MILGLAVALAAALWAAVAFHMRLLALRRELEQARSREGDAAREVLAAGHEAKRAADQQFLSRVVRALPYVIHELHGGVGRRDVPQLLLNALVRLLEPTRGLVAVARRPTGGSREHFAVAAVWPDHEQGLLGLTFAAGEGEIGLALESRRVLDRGDFDSQPEETRRRLESQTPRGFRPDLVAPLVFREARAGVVALQGPSRNPAELKDVLRLLAHLGAVALYTNARYAEMKAHADTDALTGLLNKGSVSRRLAELVREALSSDGRLCAFVFDIDHFKHYNDHNGHIAGDQLLHALAQVAREHTRPDTLCGRFGGDEFLMVFPATSRSQALAAAENVRAAIGRHPFAHAARQPLGRVTVSGGVAECPGDAREAMALLRAADAALYEAKGAGRDRVHVAVPAPASVRRPEHDAQEPHWYLSWEDAEPSSETPAEGVPFAELPSARRTSSAPVTAAASTATAPSSGTVEPVR